MKGLPYIPLYINDFMAGTRTMSAAAVGCYIRLLLHSWDVGPLPTDIKALERIAPGTRRVWPELAGKFVDGPDGSLVNKRLEEERTKATTMAASRSEVARMAAGKRWQTHANGNAQSIAESNANAMHDECQHRGQKAEDRGQRTEHSTEGALEPPKTGPGACLPASDSAGGGVPAVPARTQAEPPDRERLLRNQRAVIAATGEESPIAPRFHGRARAALTAINRSGRDALGIVTDVLARCSEASKGGAWVLKALESEAQNQSCATTIDSGASEASEGVVGPTERQKRRQGVVSNA